MSPLPQLLSIVVVLALAVEDDVPEQARPPRPDDTPAAAAPQSARQAEDRRAEQERATRLDAYHAAVFAKLREHNAEVQACARPAAGEPWVQGAVSLSWRVRPDATLTDMQVVDDTTSRARIASCLAALVEDIGFPPPPGGREVVVKHRFDVLAPQPSPGLFGWLAGLLGCG